MSIDMSQFYEVFFEEAAEHLASMESLLLAIDLGNPDGEELNAIFRAAHSIKGGAATFGFSDMAQVTHVLENLLDRVRKGEMALRADMVDAFLQAGDVLKGQLDAHRGAGEADPAEATRICAVLSALESDQPVVPVKEKSELHQFVLTIAPQANWTQDDVTKHLEPLGRYKVLEAGDVTCPWSVALETTQAELDLLEILAFIIDPEMLNVQAMNADSGEAFGFLDTDQVDDPDNQFGFFAPKAEESTESYGFFEPVGNAEAVQPDPGYGLFEPVSASAPSPTTAGGEGYGFFEPIQDKEPTKASEPVNTASVSTPTPVAEVPKSKAPEKAAASSESSSIRVSVEKVDQLLNLVGELVITQSMLAQTASQVDSVLYEKLVSGIGQLERNTRELQEAIMSIRMMPISFVFQRFPRVVRDTANKLGKQVELKMVGESTELDKGFIEKLTDPLTHLVRNSLDHGIEAPDVRVAKGKPAMGTLTLHAFHQGGNIVIEVSDDGGGLNRERILAKAKERGMAVSDSMPDSEVWSLIFEAGFSTAAQVTDVSGRGVGMDVVRKNIQAMGGRIEIESMHGVGTTMSIRLPLTLAILDGMSIAVGNEIYIIPLTFIIESMQPRPGEVKTMAGKGRVLPVRGEYLPLIALHEIFNIPPKVTDYDQGLVIILEAEGQKIAMFVDDLLGQHQVVVKNLETNYRRVPGISGATIMGDGHVAFILDVAGLVRMSQSSSQILASLTAAS